MAKKVGSKTVRLSRELIMKTALEFADREGLDKLNMRILANQLDSPVMTLYSHIKNKYELMDAMVDSVASEISIPAPDQPWRDAIGEIAITSKATFIRHPWVLSLWGSSASPAKLQHQESILRVLRQAGFSVKLACRGYHAITMHAIGFVVQAMEFPQNKKAMKTAATAFLANTSTDDIPFFVEHIRYHFDHPESEGAFEFVLTMILDGLEKLLEKK